MSDPEQLRELLATAEDAFGHAHGRPVFEPEIDATPEASERKVQIQTACRLLKLGNEIGRIGEYYGAILEHAFIIIAHTLQGYLLTMTGTEPEEIRDHTAPYEFAKGQVPLEDSTIDTLQRLYQTRRTKHYYGTTVTTELQAETMHKIARQVHEQVVTFDHELDRWCQCPVNTNGN